MRPPTAGGETPLCVVAVPDGRRRSVAGRLVDFDAVFSDLVAPAIERAGMGAVRTDRSRADAGGEGHGDERMLLCDLAIADLSSADPEIWHQLGRRDGIRPGTTLVILADGEPPPVAIEGRIAVTYRLATDGSPTSIDADAAAIAGALRTMRPHPGRPAWAAGESVDPASNEKAFYDLVDAVGVSDITRLKTDVFRDRVRYAEDVKQRLREARSSGIRAIEAVESTLGALDGVEGAVVIDLMLSYRAVGAWQEVIDLVDRMPPELSRSMMVREQLAMALNRIGLGGEAEARLLDLIAERGPNGETCAILGRVYLDRWQAAGTDGDDAEPLLRQAIAAYLQGFEADWRDAYPGINTVTLMELAEPPDERRHALLPVVRYAVERRIAGGDADYWDHATLLELAVLAADEQAAKASLVDALDRARESWEPESTARNLRLIGAARARRGESLGWTDAVEEALEARAGMPDVR